MNKKVGIITFHASHNFGSMLQAYALQQVILHMGFDCKIINFRTKKQSDFYTPRFMKQEGIKRFLKHILTLGYIKQSYLQYEIFERFLSEHLILTDRTYTTLDELEQDTELDFDYFISGSDQIWNISCIDFDWAYFLPFVKKGKRIAYAPSMGRRVLSEMGNSSDSQINACLKQYDSISVREKMTAQKICDISGYTPDVVVDPTLLYPKNEWIKLAGDTPLLKKDYLLLYMPAFDKKTFNLARKYAESKQLPVILTLLPNHSKWGVLEVYGKAEFHCVTGPLEFLNLCKYAKVIIGNSFHAVIFSMIFGRPFYAVDGVKDDRISNLLQKADILNEHNLDEENLQTLQQMPIPERCNYEEVFSSLFREIDTSLSFLKDALK